MNCRFSTFIIVFILVFIPHFFSLPSDLSIAGFEEFKKMAEEDVEKQLIKEFQEKEDEISKLSEPFQIGDMVSIKVIQGGRKRVVNGKFRGIKGNNAKIGDRKVLLSDIDELDRDRLFFGGEIQLLQLKINNLRKSLEEDKERRRESLLAQKYKKAGYTKKFFENTIELGEQFWSLRKLGDKSIYLRAESENNNEFVTLKFRHKYEIQTPHFVLLDNDPVYFFDPSNSADQEGQSHSSKSISFQILKDDLGQSRLVALKDKIRLWMVNKNSGSWLLRPLGERNRAKTNATSERVECKFRIVKSSTQKYSQDIERQFLDMVNSSKAYRKKVQDRVEEIQQKAKEDEAQRLKEIQDREAESARLEEMKQIQKQRILIIEQQYHWFTPQSARRENGTQMKVISLNTYDDVNYPKSIDNKSVEKFTDWVKIPSQSRTLYGMRYRILKVVTEEDRPQFLLHYKASFANTNLTVLQFAVSITVTFGDGIQENWDDTFELPASWAGEFHGTHEISLDKIEKTIKAVAIERKVE